MITEALGANEKGPDLQLACDHTRRERVHNGDIFKPLEAMTSPTMILCTWWSQSQRKNFPVEVVHTF